MKLLSKLKIYLLAGAGVVMSVLGIAVKILLSKNARLTRKVETQKARIKHNQAVLRADKEADEQEDVRLVELKNEIKDTGGSSTFRDPNRLFKPEDDN